LKINKKFQILLHSEVISFTSAEVEKFASVSGDFNPVHMNEEYAISQGFSGRIVHAALVVSKISGIIASTFPGEGTIIGQINWKFLLPVYIADELKIEFKLKKNKARKAVLNILIFNNSYSLVQESELIIFLNKNIL
jgi:3-hydroxybutyryl-CoA dehydratase